MNHRTILIVEDEPAIADSLSYALNAENFDTHCVSLGEEALRAFNGVKPHLIVLDVGLPDISGFEVCKAIRQSSRGAILFLTARAEEVDRIVGFELGADDYVSKPFSPREVVARIRAILRRSEQAPTNLNTDVEHQTTHQVDMTPDNSNKGPFTCDASKRLITYHGRTLQLTRYEFGILSLLLDHPKRVYSREQLMMQVWDAPETSLDRVIDTHVKGIRSKLRSIAPSENPIVTHRGVGYSLDWGKMD